MPSSKPSTTEIAPIRVRKKAAGPRARPAGFAWDPASGLLAGVDEAGRGPLAGPVVAAAVILDDRRRIRGLADSKVLTALRRDRLYDEIRDKALCCSVGVASVAEIDTLNIFHATMLAMKRAVEGLRLKPAMVLVDGNRLPRLDVACEAVVGGDATVKAISAASIIAKVHRDRLLTELHAQYPLYGFASHKGYGTPEHLEALRTHGATPHHRRFFAPVAAVLGEAALAAPIAVLPREAVPAALAPSPIELAPPPAAPRARSRRKPAATAMHGRLP